MRSFLNKVHVSWLLHATTLLLVFGFTMARSIQEIDSGELMAVQAIPGIAHPSGYPLFTWLGFLANSLFFFVEPMLVSHGLNVLLAILASLLLQKALMAWPKIKSPWVAAGSALTFSLSLRFWEQATAVEVHALHVALLSLWMWRLLEAWKFPQRNNWLWLGLITGLLFSNHLISIVLLPGLIYVWFMASKGWKTRVKLALPFALAAASVVVLFYGSLYLFSLTDPIIHWGAPNTPERFFRHIRGWQYSVWMFSDQEALRRQVSMFLKGLPLDLGPALWIALLGFFVAGKKARWVGFQLIACILYASSYQILDLEPYYLSASLALSFPFASAIQYLVNLKPKQKWLPFSVFLFPGILLFTHWDRCDRSSRDFIEVYARAALNTLPQNSLVITRQWDFFLSPVIYLQEVEKQRPDVVILGKELLRRSWYIQQKAKRHPEILEPLEQEQTLLLEKIIAFERGNPSPEGIQEAYEAFIGGLISTHFTNRPVFLGPELVEEEMSRKVDVPKPPGSLLVPHAFFFLVRPDSSYVPLEVPADEPWMLPLIPQNRFVLTILNFRKAMIKNRIGYEDFYGFKERGNQWQAVAEAYQSQEKKKE